MESPIKEKSFSFAVRVVKLYQFLVDKKEFVLSKQLLRSGTSIGAMVRESQSAESKKDFVHKLSIGLKEANESIYWLELLKETDYIKEQVFLSIHKDCLELVKLLTSIIKSSKTDS